MFELSPSGWSERSLLELGRYVNGYAFKPDDWSEDGLPIVRIAQITGSSDTCDHYPNILSDTYKLKNGDIIFSWSGTLAVVKWSGGPAWLNQHLFRVDHASGVAPEFLYHLLTASVAEMDKRSHGSTMKHIKRGELREYRVPVPDSVHEQRKIAQILDTLDTQIRHAEALVAKLERIKQGLLADLLTRGIDQNGELRPTPDQAPHLYKDSLLGWIPKEWDAKKLIELTAKVIDGSHQTPTYARSGVPFLRVTDIQSEFIDLAEVKFISQREHRQFTARCDPRRGDILLSKNGTVGIAKIVDWDWEFSIFVSLALIRVREPEQISPEFLETVLNSDIVRRQIEKRSKQGTVTNLHLEEIRDFDIPVPSEEEQKAIAQHASTFWSRLKAERHELKKLLMEKSGLMDDLLTGHARVAPLLEAKEPATQPEQQ